MKRVFIFLFSLLMIVSCTKQKTMNLTYPQAKTVDSTTNFFGTIVNDPFRWMETENDPDLKKWIEDENKLTEEFISKIPYRKDLYNRLKQLYNYERRSAPWYKGGKFFFFRNNGLQNQAILFVQNNLDQEPRELLDPNKLSEDGTIALRTLSVSKDGKYLGYAISRSGSDWQEIYIRDIETGQDLSDKIQWAKFSGITWYKDGFFYSRYPKPKEGKELTSKNLNQKIYYHKIGTPQSEDKIIFENTKEPENGFGASISNDEKYLIISEWKGTSGNRIYFKDLSEKNSQFIQLNKNFDFDWHFVGYLNGKLLFITNFKAPNYKLVGIDPQNPEIINWKDILPERDYVLRNVSIADNDKLIAHYLKDVVSYIDVLDANGQLLYHLTLPAPGSASLSVSKNLDFGFITLSSYTYPGTIFKYDVKTGKLVKFWEPKINGINLDDYITEEKFYTSFDGTKIPIFIVHKKNVKLNDQNPTWLYGYGGFNISLTPRFSVLRMLWLENGGVFAVANIRGGGEYGEKWHKAGIKLNKKNVFKDFIAAAEYLIKEKYTNSQYLVIQGGSNGGLLVGAVVNMRPDLFKVAFPQVGVMDMLRYYKFTIGRAWAADYGLPTDSKEMFEYLYSYSPLHNINCDKNKVYPAIMVITADHDDRVVPAHSFKYIATLQKKCKDNPNPLLIRIETKAGHGAGKPTEKILEEWADMYAFAYWNIGILPHKSLLIIKKENNDK